MIRRKGIGIVIAGLVMGFAALPLAAFAAADTAGLKSFNAQGVGTGAIASGNCTTPAIACAGSDVCECLTGTQTIIANQGFNKASFTFALSLDMSTTDLPISTAGSCFPATGSGTISNTNGKKTLVMDISGLSCPNADNTANVFNGTYNVTSGTGGKTPFATGTGAINGSLEGTVSRASVNGNVQP